MATDTDNTVNKIFQYKLVLLGESSVGKSSLVLRFVKGQFLDFQESTIGGEFFSFFLLPFHFFFSSNFDMLFFFLSTAAFLTQTVCLNDTTVKFEIWDTFVFLFLLFFYEFFLFHCDVIEWT